MHKIVRFFAKIFAIFGGIAPIVALAAGVTDFSISLSSLTAGESANHVIRFVTPSGVGSPADGIVLGYASAFDLTALSFPDDVDLAIDDNAACDGPFTDKTLAASASAGIWGVSRSGTTLTFTPPTDAGGSEIAAGRCVQIQIGTNADFGTFGTGQIENPSSVGSYPVTLGGGFGDIGGSSVGIVDSDDVVVEACVGDACGGGAPAGGGGSVSQETTPPLILDLRVEEVTDTSAVISWNTDEAADATLAYGRTEAYELGSFTDTSLVYSHTFSLTDLEPETRYYVRVTSEDLVGNSASAAVVFSTSDETAPEIMDVQVTGITQTQAYILWLTDEPATTLVRYGAQADVNRLSLYPFTYTDTSLLTDHIVSLDGLTSGTTYVFVVESTDVAGNRSVSDPLSFTTQTDVPPANIPLVLMEVGENNVLSWEMPTESDVLGFVLTYRTDRYPLNPFDGVMLLNGWATQVIHEDVEIAVPYHYTLFVFDDAGHFSSGSLAFSLRTEETVPPEAPPETIPPGGAPASGEPSGSATPPTEPIPVEGREEPISGEQPSEPSPESPSPPEDDETGTRPLPQEPSILRSSTIPEIVPIIAIALLVFLLALAVITRNLLSRVHYLFSLPFLFLSTGGGKHGTVYDAKTHVPVPFATVQLIRTSDGECVATTVTDRHGQYRITSGPGSYRLFVRKMNYRFPSRTTDREEKGADVYRGNTIRLTSARNIITIPIPLDRV